MNRINCQLLCISHSAPFVFKSHLFSSFKLHTFGCWMRTKTVFNWFPITGSFFSVVAPFRLNFMREVMRKWKMWQDIVKIKRITTFSINCNRQRNNRIYRIFPLSSKTKQISSHKKATRYHWTFTNHQISIIWRY